MHPFIRLRSPLRDQNPSERKVPTSTTHDFHDFHRTKPLPLVLYWKRNKGPLTNFAKREMRSFPRRCLISPLLSCTVFTCWHIRAFCPFILQHNIIWMDIEGYAHASHFASRNQPRSGRKSFKFNFPFVRPAAVSSWLSTKTEKLFLTHPRSEPGHKQSQLPWITQCHYPPVQTVTRPDLITLSKLITDS